MSATVFFSTLSLPAAVFTLAYFPVVTHLARGMASAYPKADVRKRLLAATLDGLLVVTCCLVYWKSQSVQWVAAGAGYLLLRDAIGGQSVGKLLVGLTVISLETGRPCAWTCSVRRNLLLLLPGANVAAIFLEAGTLVRDPQGQRLGDRLAQTQVVEGLGAKDLVKVFQAWLADLGAGLGRSVGRPRRVRGRASMGAAPTGCARVISSRVCRGRKRWS
jgi:uncharacterized RDD family membrane protein YckC